MQRMATIEMTAMRRLAIWLRTGKGRSVDWAGRSVYSRLCRSRGFAILPLALLACGCVSPGTQAVAPIRLSPEIAAQPTPDPAIGRSAPSAIGRAVLAAEEPAAAAIGLEVLDRGGNAVDAAVATAAAMAVTLPSRAGFGGGGACLVHDLSGDVIAVDFLPDRGEPRLSAGLRAMHDRWGRTGWADLLAPARDLAENGFEVEEGLAIDFAGVEEVLARDPAVAAVFGDGAAGLSDRGARIVQPELGRTIAHLATATVATAAFSPPLSHAYGPRAVHFAPSKTSRGMESLAIFQFATEERNYALASFDERAHLAVEAQRRAFGEAPQTIAYDPLGATARVEAGDGDTRFGTTLAAVDDDGLGIVCGLTLNGLFGRGTLDPTGAFVAAPADDEVGSLAGLAMVTVNRRLMFGIAAADLPPALVVPLLERVVAGRTPEAAIAIPRVAPDPSTVATLVETSMPSAIVERLTGRGHVVRNAERLGRAAVIDCEAGPGICVAVADPRADGIAVSTGQAGS